MSSATARLTLMAESAGAQGGGWGRRFPAQTPEKNKQVSKVMEKISELETNVFIMRAAD